MSPFTVRLHKYNYSSSYYKPKTATRLNCSPFPGFWPPPLSPLPPKGGQQHPAHPVLALPGPLGSSQVPQAPSSEDRPRGPIHLPQDSQPGLPCSPLFFFFYSLLVVIIGKEGRSYKYLLKLKGACIVLAERENIREVLVLLPTPIPKCLL